MADISLGVKWSESKHGLTQSELKSALHYNPQTGVFTWLRPPKRGKHKAGGIAGGPSNGYIDICIDRKRFKAHRLAWFYVHGEWPAGLIDHINNDPSDNRIENLRIADRAENGWNARRKRNNKSGVTGVYYAKREGLWVAEIFARGKKHSLGHFKTKEEAAAARKDGEREHFGEYSPQPSPSEAA
jgi:hypothetical protein